MRDNINELILNLLSQNLFQASFKLIHFFMKILKQSNIDFFVETFLLKFLDECKTYIQPDVKKIKENFN